MKRVLVLLLTAVVMFAFAGCGSEVTDDAQNEATKESATYQDIFDEYSEQIKTATSKLVDEYNKEADGVKGDIEKLAEISNDKITELAKIETKGTEKMAELMYENGDDYDLYEKWAQKLYDVYEECAGEITDAYMDSAI